MPAETSRAICSLIFSGTLEKCKNLRICFAHGGGSFPFTIGRIEHGFEVRPDLCAIDNPHNPRSYLGKFWLDSLVHDAELLDRLVNLAGAEKIALGTDYPFPLGESQPGKMIEASGFDEETKAKLLHGAALEWLNLDKRSFD
jgi:aminocarboxymuconate-semialdehyde decarboxylase